MCIRDSLSYGDVAGGVGDREVSFGGDVAVHPRRHPVLGEASAASGALGGQDQLVARDDGAAEPHRPDPGQVADPARAREGEDHPGELGHRLDDDHAGQHGLAREVALEPQLGAGDVLGRRSLDARLHLAHAVEQEHGPAVREHLADLVVRQARDDGRRRVGRGAGLDLGRHVERHAVARSAGLTSSASRDTEPKTAISLSYSATPNSASMAT